MRKKFGILLALLMSLPVFGQDSPTKLTVQEYLGRPTISSPQVSPDGSLIVYSLGEKEAWDGQRIYHLWLMSSDGSKKLRLTNAEKSDWGPQWSPDGSKVAFFSTRSGNRQVHVIRPNGGEARQITFAEKGVNLFRWINNSIMAYVTTEPRDPELIKAEEAAGGGYIVGTKEHTSSLWIQSLARETERKKITEGAYYISAMAAASDGKKFLLHAAQNSDLYHIINGGKILLIDDSGHELFAFTEAKAFGELGFSPDNSKISFVGSTVGYSAGNSLFITDLQTMETTDITREFDPTIQSVRWLDARTVTFLSLRRCYTGIYSVPAEGGEVMPLLEPYFVTFSYSLNPTRKRLVFYGSHGHRPPALCVHNFREDPERARIVYSPNKWMETKDLARTKVVRYPSYDRAVIEAVLTFPPDYKPDRPYPLVVLPHGGPDGMSLDDFGFFPQLFAQEGMIVFEPNFRGSIGFGSDFYKANRGKLGIIDYKDIMTGVDYLVHRGLANPSQMVVGGWSYGGYMTNWIISQTDRFKAAVSVAGYTNNGSRYGPGDINHSDLARWEYLDVPVLNMENYMSSSPITYLKNCKTPTLIMHGENDRRVPVSQAWELYRALNDIGVEVRMVLYPDSGHGISNPKQFADVMTRWVNWYKRFLEQKN
jgi:dipeptidyl aminopeptidase/acylaminoacyl peptidase